MRVYSVKVKWQFNDCWPVISWSSNDYYQRPKALYYFVKKAYKPVILSIEKNEDSLRLYFISDKQNTLPAKLTVKLTDFKGKQQETKTLNVNIPPASSKIFLTFSIDSLLKNYIPEETVLNIQLKHDSLLLDEHNYYFTKPANLKLPAQNISVKAKAVSGGYEITLTSGQLAKNVELSVDAEGFFDDNFFDLLPGETKTVRFTTGATINDLSRQLKTRTLNKIRNRH